jgi:hypothetical protein
MNRGVISLVMLCSFFASSKKFWYEDQSFDLQIVKSTLTKQSASFTIRLRNDGTSSIFLAAPVGRDQPASLDIERLNGERWIRISNPSDVRASCSISIRAQQSMEFHKDVSLGSAGEIRASITVFPDVESCKQNRYGFTFSSPTATWPPQ